MQTKPQYFQAHFEPINRKDAMSKKAQESKSGTIIKGYASTSTVDRYNDIVDPEAFRQSIKSNYRKNPIVLFQHNPHHPIGKATMMTIDSKGLYIEAIIHDAEIEPKIQAGILKAFSIGYIPTRLEFQDEEGNMLDPNMEDDRRRIWLDPSIKRVIKELDLVENSVVSVPANPDALFTLEKSVKNFFDKEAAKLYGVNLTPEDMKKSKKVNLLEVKDGEDEAAEVETPEVEAPENEETPEEKPQETTPENTPVEAPEKPVESPADETSGEGEGDETPADDKEPVAETPETPEAEAPVEGEKALEIDPKNLTAEQVGLMFKTISTLQSEGEAKDARIAELEAEIGKTPAKKALMYSEHKQFSESKAVDGEKVDGEPEMGDQKTGFKDAFVASAV